MKNIVNHSINRFAYDFSNISQLRREAVSGSSESIKKVADQFETLFINMMMQSMRKAVPSGGLFNQSSMQLFTSMFDQQIAQQAAGKGFGLADIIAKQLTNKQLAQSLFGDNNQSSNLTPEALGQILYQQYKTNNLTQTDTNELSLQTALDGLNKGR